MVNESDFKTKNQVITVANDVSYAKQSEREVNACCYRKTRENAGVLVSDWFKKSARFES